MGAEITFRCRVVVGINVESVVWTSLHASFASDATTVVEIYNSVRSAVQGAGGTNLGAWRVITVVAPHDAEVA
jgi:hypothetical protein